MRSGATGRRHVLGVLLSVGLLAAPAWAQTIPSAPADSAAPPPKPASGEDGWPDLSSFIDSRYGFLPILSPITEPAVGYGVAGGMAFLDRPLGNAQAGFDRPNISLVGGLLTENDSWAGGAADQRHWLDDRLQTLTGIIYADVNLDYYGIGGGGTGGERSLGYNLATWYGLLEGKYRLGASQAWAGLRYAFARTDVTFDAPEETSDLPDFESTSDVGGLTPGVTFDSRNNIFTPTAGTYAEASLGFYAGFLGSDDDFQSAEIIAMQFVPLGSGLYLGLRGEWKAAYGDAPFYMLPYIDMRGAAMMRFLGDTVAQAEAELRWQFWKRISLVGFGGYGTAAKNLDRVALTKTIQTGGAGLRYDMARRYGVHAGIDVGFGPDETAIYFVTGSSWMRP